MLKNKRSDERERMLLMRAMKDVKRLKINFK